MALLHDRFVLLHKFLGHYVSDIVPKERHSFQDSILLFKWMLGDVSRSFQEPNGLPQNGQSYFPCAAYGTSSYIMESALEHNGYRARSET